MSFWTDPYPAPGPAFEQARFQLHAAPISGVLDSIMREREQQQHQLSQATQQAVSGLGSYMQKQQTDQIASQLLNQAAYQGYDEQGNMLGDPLARSLVENGPDHPTDAWAAYQQMHAQQGKQAEENAKINEYNALADKARRGPAGGGQSGGTIYDPSGNPIQTTAHDAYQYWYGGGQPQSPTGQPAIKNDVLANSVPAARGRLTNNKFDNAYPEAASGDVIKVITPQGKELVMPYTNYQAYMSQRPAAVQHNAPQLPANPTPPDQSAPSLMPQGKAPAVGTKGTVNGVAAVWDGVGWKRDE